MSDSERSRLGSTAKELFDFGADPIDITAARLLWKSPWWAKVLESMEDIPVTEEAFLRTLGRLYRDCRRSKSNSLSIEEFCDLATIARKIRWKFPNGRPGFGQKYLRWLKEKLSHLQWNRSICRFEPKVTDWPELAHWNALSSRQKKKFRRSSQFKERRKLARLEREKNVSRLITQALEPVG